MAWLFPPPQRVSKAPSRGTATPPWAVITLSATCVPLLQGSLPVALPSHRTCMRGSLLSTLPTWPLESLESPFKHLQQEPKTLLTLPYIPRATTGHLHTFHHSEQPCSRDQLSCRVKKGPPRLAAQADVPQALHSQAYLTPFTVISSCSKQTLLKKSWLMGSNV